MWVRLVLDDEDDVGGDAAGGLVAFPRECDFSAFLPATLDLDGQDLVLGACGAAVRVQATA